MPINPFGDAGHCLTDWLKVKSIVKIVIAIKENKMENYEKKTIEEKAKAYDEKVSQAREMLKDGTISQNVINYIQHLFPELTETEDEKIRKTLIAFFNDLHKTKSHCWGLPIPTILDWLGKQSEVVRLDEQIWQIANNSAKTWEQSFAILQATQTAYNKGKKDALKEQKPTDKTEPKFHEGDWVVYVCGEESTTLQISRIIEGTYEFTDGSSLNVVDEDTLHHWTIQDAKDGDVLITNKKQPFIFNGHYDKDTDYIYAYCGISDFVKDDSFLPCDEEFKVWGTNENVCPATKEQRDILFSKMREAGYEWDAEKKELKKVEQKPTWSEEDEEILSMLIELVESKEESMEAKVELVVWLKSLKDRIGG